MKYISKAILLLFVACTFTSCNYFTKKTTECVTTDTVTVVNNDTIIEAVDSVAVIENDTIE